MSVESGKASRPLDALNFFLADVRDGLGPYLAIYLLTIQRWDEASIGIVMTIAGLAALLTQTPAGALVDAVRAKRSVIIGAALLVTGACLVLPLISGFWAVAVSQAIGQAAGSVFAPAVAAVTLGIVGPAAFTRRTGRNEAFNHAGNAFAATAAGISAYVFGSTVVFWLMAFMALASIGATLSIPAKAIDYELARGFRTDADDEQPSGFRILLECRPLLIFAGCAALFHFANAAMLPLVGQKLALGDRNQGTALMSACIVAAQIVMVPMAMLVGARADSWGRKPLLLAAFAVLPLRGVLYTLWDNPYWLVGVQSLDGVGAGLFGALFPLVVADLTRGTGRFNVSLGAITTVQGVGASLSTAAAGLVVVEAGYGAAFLMLAAVAGVAFALLLLAMPESRDDAAAAPSEQPPVTPAGSAPSPRR